MAVCQLGAPCANLVPGRWVAHKVNPPCAGAELRTRLSNLVREAKSHTRSNTRTHKVCTRWRTRSENRCAHKVERTLCRHRGAHKVNPTLCRVARRTRWHKV